MRSDNRDDLLYEQWLGEHLPTEEEQYEIDQDIERQIDEERTRALIEKVGRRSNSDRADGDV